MLGGHTKGAYTAVHQAVQPLYDGQVCSYQPCENLLTRSCLALSPLALLAHVGTITSTPVLNIYRSETRT
jgi:hypothetical protein